MIFATVLGRKVKFAGEEVWIFMDEIYEWLNPRIPVEYVLISFLVLSVAIVIGMLVMNIALFVPIGLLLGGLGFKNKKILLSGICLSGIIEVSQFAFCKGLCETDDVMHNSVGAFLGYLGFLGILKGKRILFSKFSGSF